MSNNWVQQHKRDYYYRKAKQLDYRSRASFKLIQIDDRFNILRPGKVVVDLGAAPGGWLQVAAERVGGEGRVIGVDLQSIAPIEGAMVETIIGDVRKPETVERLLYMSGGKVDVVLSDMSPNISGQYAMDHARSIELCEHALTFAKNTLVTGGCLVIKVFEGDMMKDLVKEVKASFSDVRLHAPKATRSTSTEIYIIARDFNGEKKPKAPLATEVPKREVRN